LGKTTACPAPLPAEPTTNFELGKYHCQKAFASQNTDFAFAVRFASIPTGAWLHQPKLSLAKLCARNNLFCLPSPPKPTNAFTQNSPQRPQASPKPETPKGYRNSQAAIPNFFACRHPIAVKPAQNFARTLPTGNRFCPQALKLKTTLAL